jgi:hypothetical protein
MVRRIWPVLGVLALVGGCVPLDAFKVNDGGDMPVVGASPFGATATQTASVSAFTPGGDHEVALHVDCVARKIKAANKDTGLDPKFAIVGVQAPELFHQGPHVVYVTEGLVKACKTEGELAALLCLELGKMASEREAFAAAQKRQAEERPPIDMPIGNAGQFNAGDGVRQAELARYDQQRPKRQPPPDPQALARVYLEKAGYAKTDLDGAAPLLRSAERNFTVEKQFRGPSWTAVSDPPR